MTMLDNKHDKVMTARLRLVLLLLTLLLCRGHAFESCVAIAARSVQGSAEDGISPLLKPNSDSQPVVPSLSVTLR
jgi:hypothetical protein